MKYPVCFVVVLTCCVALSAAYTTSGNRVYDPNGNPILIRGIARPSLEWNTAGQYMQLSDYQLMKNWGANVVRLSLNQCFWISGLSGYSSSYVTTVDQQVTWIKSLGMGVILDLHWSNQGNSANGCGQQTMPDSYSTTFWQQVATKYKNDAWVMFELYNEPHDVSWSVWKSGGDAGGYTSPGFQSLYNTVRGTGANNVVIIGGLNYAYDLTGVPANAISGTNIAYCTHPYANSGKQPSDWDTYIKVALAYPIIATEFGNYDCTTSYYASWISYCNTNNIGWCGWGWFVQGCGFPSMINDWNGTPSATGALIKAELTSGSKVPSSSSAAATSTTKAATTTTTGKASTTTTTTGKASTTTTTGKASTTTTTGKASTTTTTGTTGTSSNTIPVYTDSVQTPFADWSWASVRNPSDTTHYSGSYSYSFQPSNYGALYFYYSGGIKTSIHKSIDMYVNPGSGGQKVNFNMIKYDGSNSNKVGPDAALSSYATGSSLPANTWTKVSVPLSSFSSSATSFDGFWCIDQSGSSQTTMYVDSITVVGI